MKNNKHFIKFLILIPSLFLLFVLANKVNSIFGYVAFFACLVFSLFLNVSESFGLILFLLPNIRILDCCGQTSLINLLIVFVVLKSFLSSLFNNGDLRFVPFTISITVIFFFIELSHSVLSDSNITNSLFTSLNIAFNIFSFSFFAFKLDLEKNVSFFSKLLLFGVICTSFAFLIVNFSSFNNFLYSWSRFSAYGNDPNYLSMYILLGSSGILIGSFRHFSIQNIVLVLVPLLIGLLTTSKMYVMCLAILLLAYLVLLLKNKKIKMLILALTVFGIAILAFWYIDSNAFGNLFNRFYNRFSSASNFNELTTGRLQLLNEYFNGYISDPISFFFGRGINYYDFYSGITAVELVSHNTYLDLFLSWGVIGSLCFIVFLFCILGKLEKAQKISLVSFLPLILFLIMIFALSCLSSDMFWYLLIFVIAPLKSRAKTSSNLIIKHSFSFQQQ